MDKFDKVAITIWVASILFALAFWTAVIFVAVHFLSKVW